MRSKTLLIAILILVVVLWNCALAGDNFGLVMGPIPIGIGFDGQTKQPVAEFGASLVYKKLALGTTIELSPIARQEFSGLGISWGIYPIRKEKWGLFLSEGILERYYVSNRPWFPGKNQTLLVHTASIRIFFGEGAGSLRRLALGVNAKFYYGSAKTLYFGASTGLYTW